MCSRSFHPITQRPRAGDPGSLRNGCAKLSCPHCTKSEIALLQGTLSGDTPTQAPRPYGGDPLP
jgi:hypothetical protein